jgi:hypothetical protein
VTKSTASALCLAYSKSCSDRNLSLKNSLGGLPVPDLRGALGRLEADEFLVAGYF